MNPSNWSWTDPLVYTLVPWVVLVNNMPWVGLMVELLVAMFATMVVHRVGTALLYRLTLQLPYSNRIVQYGHRAAGVALFLLTVQVILRSAPDNLGGISTLRHIAALLLISSITWWGLRCVKAVGQTILDRNPADTPDNLQARRIQTQTRVLTRSLMVVIVLAGSGFALMTLPLLRQLGTSLLASAGVAGLVVGFAAKPVLGNLLAGIQLALTQPIRLQDVVIVENEWGWVEEITGTYVVVRIWDQRRMIVPLQWFIEHPFQNWTRTSSDILGTVTIWTDYRMPVDAFRKEAERLCQNAPDWDGRLVVTHVVDANERAMQLRVLVSAADAGRTWELRCFVREGLIDFIQRTYPEFLPRLRIEIDGDAPAGLPGKMP
ncbi:mechanosensitive ion channel [Oxalobacteraceae bacterium OM1]|nr:mechanosensitive ion channel [Oxalobacteraceae bacterium OM1]